MNPSLTRPAFPTGFLLLLGSFCIYTITLSRGYPGYEGETIAQARSLLHGTRMEGRAGLLDVIFYTPFVALDDFIRGHAILPFYQGLMPNFALSFFMSLTVGLVFLSAREI